MLGLCACLLAGTSMDVNSRVMAQSQVPAGSVATLVSTSAAKDAAFTVTGNEPFWNVSISRGSIVYSSPEEVKRQTFPYVTPMTAANRPDDVLRVYRLRGRPEGMLILKRTSNCSDGMSDKSYPYSATLILGNRAFEGCAQNK